MSLEEKSELQAQSCQYFLKYLYENILKDESLAAKQKEFLTDSDNLFFKQNVAYSLSSELMELSLTGDKRKDIESIRNRLIKQLLEKEFPLDDFLIHVYFQNSHPKYFLRNCMDNVKEELTDQAPASEEEQKNFLNDLLMVKKIMGTHAYTKPEYINLLESKVLDDQNLSVEKKLEYIEKKYGNTFASVYAKFGVIKNSIYGAPISECGVLRSLELIKKLLIETKFLGSFCDIMTIVHSAHDNSSYKFPHYTITNFNAEEFIDSLERK